MVEDGSFVYRITLFVCLSCHSFDSSVAPFFFFFFFVLLSVTPLLSFVCHITFSFVSTSLFLILLPHNTFCLFFTSLFSFVYHPTFLITSGLPFAYCLYGTIMFILQNGHLSSREFLIQKLIVLNSIFTQPYHLYGTDYIRQSWNRPLSMLWHS